METFTDSYGKRLAGVHDKTDDCATNGCAIHAPSDHHMKTWPLLWRSDRGFFERIDTLGCGHPDPDSLSFIRRTRGDTAAYIEGIHGCTGMCSPDSPLLLLNTEADEEKV